MTWLDQAILNVAPVWGAKRIAARAAVDQLRAYDLAKNSRRTEGWLAADSGANAEIASAGDRPRNRARDFVRNNMWASAAVRKLATKVVGTGIVPRLQADSAAPARRKALMALWNEWVEHCDPEGRHDFYGLQHLAVRCMFESGEVLIRKIRLPSSSKLKIPFQIQILEPDHLDSSRIETHQDGSAIIMGVHFNKDGSRRGYWMFPQHPGEVISSWSGMSRLESEFVPAKEILHVFAQDRPGQVRGVTAFAAAGLKLRDLDEYDDAELWKKKIAACFVGFVSSPSGTAKPMGLSSPNAAGERSRRMAPGQMLNGLPGEEVTFSSPPTDDTYADYMRCQLRAIASGIGCTYEQLTGDLSALNFSSIKAGLNDFYDLLDYWQYIVFIKQFCQPVWEVFAEYAIASGAWPASKPLLPRWVPPRRRWVDITKEIPALIEAVQAGFMPLSEIYAEQGEDADERLDEIARMNQALDERGIVLTSDARTEIAASRAAAPKQTQAG